MKKPERITKRIIIEFNVEFNNKSVDEVITKLTKIKNQYNNARFTEEWDGEDSYAINLYQYDIEPDEEFNKRMEEWQKWKDSRKDIEAAANEKRRISMAERKKKQISILEEKLKKMKGEL